MACSSAWASPRKSSASSKRNDSAVTSGSPAFKPSTPPVSRIRSKLPDFSMYVSRRTNRRAGFWWEYATCDIFTITLMNSRKLSRTWRWRRAKGGGGVMRLDARGFLSFQAGQEAYLGFVLRAAALAQVRHEFVEADRVDDRGHKIKILHHLPQIVLMQQALLVLGRGAKDRRGLEFHQRPQGRGRVGFPQRRRIESIENKDFPQQPLVEFHHHAHGVRHVLGQFFNVDPRPGLVADRAIHQWQLRTLEHGGEVDRW